MKNDIENEVPVNEKKNLKNYNTTTASNPRPIA